MKEIRKVCIVGASGKLGRYMVGHSLDRGYEVVGVCRESSVGKLDRFKGGITIIPGATERNENITGIGRFVAGHLKDRISRWELCSFNNLCRDKYLRLGLDWPFKESSLLTKERMEELTEIARDSGVDPDIVSWSGPTRVEQSTPDSESNTSESIMRKDRSAAI